jgi:hypothetical protein
MLARATRPRCWPGLAGPGYPAEVPAPGYPAEVPAPGYPAEVPAPGYPASTRSRVRRPILLIGGLLWT